MSIQVEIKKMCIASRVASSQLSRATPEMKNNFLLTLANLLLKRENELLKINEQDIEAAKAENMDAPRIDRLALTKPIIKQMAEACTHVAALPDPVGAMDTQWIQPNGMLVGKMRIPLGVIAMIYEARPNVTIDAAILCIKAGNAVILRGGREAFHSNRALASLLDEAATQSGLPPQSAQLVGLTDRKAVDELCRMDQYIDVIIPRGGENLIRKVSELARMPVLKHYKGVCHAFIEASANLEEACKIIENSKTQRPAVCNALEGLLVDRKIAEKFLPMLAATLSPHEVTFHCDQQTLSFFTKNAVPLAETDRGREFHSMDLSVVMVDDLENAIKYISTFGSNHTEIICTSNYDAAMRFLREVDASMVGVNVSSRFNDGGELGLGAEIGISTSKLHAYGPMGVKELTTTKFVVLGNGQIRK